MYAKITTKNAETRNMRTDIDPLNPIARSTVPIVGREGSRDTSLAFHDLITLV